MIARYRRYRGYGHGRFVAATLAPPPVLFYGAIVVIGTVFGVAVSTVIG